MWVATYFRAVYQCIVNITKTKCLSKTTVEDSNAWGCYQSHPPGSERPGHTRAFPGPMRRRSSRRKKAVSLRLLIDLDHPGVQAYIIGLLSRPVCQPRSIPITHTADSGKPHRWGKSANTHQIQEGESKHMVTDEQREQMIACKKRMRH